MCFKVRRVIFTHSEHRGLKFHPSLIFSTVRGAVLFALLSASGVVLKKMRLGSGVEKKWSDWRGSAETIGTEDKNV
jgi:hypothetical protein